jgi:hypothetical protein
MTPRNGFAQEHFGTAQLGDKRRVKRLVKSAEQILQHPGGTLPDKFANPADLDAFYLLMNNKAVTHAAILASHQEVARRKMAEHETVLILHDTTELDYSGLSSVAGLGQIGNGHGRGYQCHNSLAVVPGSREVLGLVNQILFNRPRVDKGESKAQGRERKNRESRLWKQASQAVGATPSGCLWVDVCDRGADITEFLDYEERADKKYVVRGYHNRRILLDKDGKKQRSKLHDLVRSLAAEKETRTLEVPARPGQAARTAEVAIAYQQVWIVPPRQARGEHGREPLQVWVIRVWEVNPPTGVEALEWILVTNLEVSSVAAAWDRVDWYSHRWIIEELHKCQKTGCGIELLQFTTQEALQPTIALLSVTAVFLLQLRDASRREDAQKRPATEMVPELYVQVISLWRYGEERSLTLQEFFYAVARLGGHQNRKHDHRPGWLVLWRGWTKLLSMAAVAAMLSKTRCPET